jgi:hypothetical protein
MSAKAKAHTLDKSKLCAKKFWSMNELLRRTPMGLTL